MNLYTNRLILRPWKETDAVCLKEDNVAIGSIGLMIGEKSKRVQEKCGFTYHHTNKDIYWKLMDDIRTEHITCLSKEAWYLLK